MSFDQGLLLTLLLATMTMFIRGRWRHDMVALAALLACVLTGLVPSADAFSGFAHPAVITVACVLVLSRALQTSGAVDLLARHVMPGDAGPMAATAAITLLAAVLSAFMNNVGALALLMPLAIKTATRHEYPPGRVLMPLAVGSILGGMTTLIGTPTNLIVAGFRAGTGAPAFSMFDFTPVGVVVAAAGILFMLLVGWRLVPVREPGAGSGFELAAYLTEARVGERAKAVGMTLRRIEDALAPAGAQVVGLIRDGMRVPGPHPARKVRPGDILVIEADSDALASALSVLGLELEEDKPAAGADGEATVQSEEIVLGEYAVLPESDLVGRSARDLRLRTRYAINLLALSRQGRRSTARLRTMRLQAGDVLLMQGPPEALGDFAAQFDCVPLAERQLRLPDRRQALTATGILAASVIAVATGLLPAAIAFAAGVLASLAAGTISPRAVYRAVDWPVIVLLAALIPVAGAMESTGAASLIAHGMLETLARGHAVAALVILLIVTMTLSDFMNNAATAAVMCPIAIGVAGTLGLDVDAFLMAVAVGASCAFLTPIGHQNNTLILGPAGFRFGDYWRLGLTLEVLVVACAVPMILIVWPF